MLHDTVTTVTSPLSCRRPSMETPLDVLSRAASFVHANEEESKFYLTLFLLWWHVRTRWAFLSSPSQCVNCRTGSWDKWFECFQSDPWSTNVCPAIRLNLVFYMGTIGVFVLYKLPVVDCRQISATALNGHTHFFFLNSCAFSGIMFAQLSPFASLFILSVSLLLELCRLHPLSPRPCLRPLSTALSPSVFPLSPLLITSEGFWPWWKKFLLRLSRNGQSFSAGPLHSQPASD